MAQKTFDVSINGKKHTIDVLHNPWTTQQRVTIDGEIRHEKKSLSDTSMTKTFKVGGKWATVCSYPKLTLDYGLDVVIDGRSVTTGEPVTVNAEMPTIAKVATGVLVPGVVVVFPLLGVPIQALNGAIMGFTLATGYVIIVLAVKNIHLQAQMRYVLYGAGVLVGFVLTYIIFFVLGWGSDSGTILRDFLSLTETAFRLM